MVFDFTIQTSLRASSLVSTLARRKPCVWGNVVELKGNVFSVLSDCVATLPGRTRLLLSDHGIKNPSVETGLYHDLISSKRIMQQCSFLYYELENRLSLSVKTLAVLT